MRLSERNEGHISNYQRVIDGFLAGLPYDRAPPRAAQDQREPPRDAHRRDRVLRTAGANRTAPRPTSPQASAPPWRPTPTRSTTAGPTTSSPCSAPTACSTCRASAATSGHDALREAYGQWQPVRPQRHLVLNTLVTEWDDDEARATSDVVFLLKGERGWAVQLVGRYHDVLHRDGDAWRFHSRVAEFTDRRVRTRGRRRGRRKGRGAGSMRFGLDVAQQRMSWDELVRRVRLAEDLGFDGVWGFDHFQPMYGDGTGRDVRGHDDAGRPVRG